MFSRLKKDIQKFYRYSLVSAKSQLKSEVANSYLNWIWWILDPLCFMMIYSYVFGNIFKAREPNFAIYIFIGLSMWNFFNKTVVASVKMVKSNKAIVSKVYVPKFILLLTRMWVNGFKMLVSFAIVAVMLLVARVQLTVNVLFFIPILLTLFLLTFGCGCFMMHYGVYVEDLAHVTNIAMKMLFYMTGIFYNLEKRIPTIGKALNIYNPVAFLLTSMRNSILYGNTPNLTMLLFWLVFSLLLALLGARKIYKEENSYVKFI